MPFDDPDGMYTPKQERPSLFWTFFVLALLAIILVAIDLSALAVVLAGLMILFGWHHARRISGWFVSGWRRIKQDPIVAQF